MDIHFATIEEAGARLRSGNLTSESLTRTMLDRIEALNPVLNAYITVTGELALSQARAADARMAAGEDLGPLHGIPVAVKDLFDTKGIRTTCGSRLYTDRIPDHDAEVVIRLREAGAVLLGKTGLHELAYGTTSINPFFGPVRNPWATDNDAGGSSGGSAAAVAAGLAFGALGTDTGCSIRQPAHCCGVVGHKPTFGLVSRSGVFPLSWTMDHVGPITRSVADAAILLGAIAGHDPADLYSAPGPTTMTFTGTSAPVDGIRLGVVRDHFFEGRAEVVAVVDAAVQKLADTGASLVDLKMTDVAVASDAARTMFIEALVVHEESLAKRPDDFGDDVRLKLENSRKRSAVDYARARHFKPSFTRQVEGLFRSCDVLVTPTATIAAAPIDDRPADYGALSVANTQLSDLTGQPSISIPCGFTPGGLPVGLMLTGPLFADEQVLRVAKAAEAVLGYARSHPPL